MSKPKDVTPKRIKKYPNMIENEKIFLLKSDWGKCLFYKIYLKFGEGKFIQIGLCHVMEKEKRTGRKKIVVKEQKSKTTYKKYWIMPMVKKMIRESIV